MNDITRVKSSNTKAVIWVSILVLLVLVAGGLYWYLNMRKGADDTSKDTSSNAAQEESATLTESEKIDDDIGELEDLAKETSDNDFSDKDISDQSLGL